MQRAAGGAGAARQGAQRGARRGPAVQAGGSSADSEGSSVRGAARRRAHRGPAVQEGAVRRAAVCVRPSRDGFFLCEEAAAVAGAVRGPCAGASATPMATMTPCSKCLHPSLCGLVLSLPPASSVTKRQLRPGGVQLRRRPGRIRRSCGPLWGPCVGACGTEVGMSGFCTRLQGGMGVGRRWGVGGVVGEGAGYAFG